MSSSERSDEMLALLEAHCEERLAPAETQRLQQLVVDNEEAAWLYVRYMHQHALLERCEQGLNVGPLVDRLVDSMTAGVSDLPPSPSVTARGRWTTAWQRGLQAVRRMPVVSLLAAVGVVGALLVGLAIVAAPRFQRKEQANTVLPVVAKPYVARLTQMQDAQWESEPALLLGAHLYEGQYVKLKAGLAEITFKDGAAVVLEGPATLGITSKAETHLASGGLVAHVPSRAIGFTVTAATTKIVDLGTEFGVAVDAEGQVSVRVFEGMVSVELNQTADGQDVQPARRIVMANEAVRVAPGSSTFEAAPKNTIRQFVRMVPEKAKQGVTHPLVLKNPSFERPDIRRHPKFSAGGRELGIPVFGWRTSDFPDVGVPGGISCQGQYAISDNGEKPIVPPATDGNQLMWLCLDKNYPEFHEGWVFQSLGIVDQEDVGQRLRLSADVSAKSYYMGPRDGPCEGAAVSVAFVTGVAAMQPGQVVGTPGTWPEMLVKDGWKTLTATLTITPEMIGEELFVRLMASDPEPRSLRDAYQWDNVRCAVEP